MGRPRRCILALEPWYGGSHRAFLDQWRARSRHAVEVHGLAPRHWKWRMRSSAWELARRLGGPPPDALLASDYVDLPALVGFLPPEWARVPAVAYFHENQLTYPVSARAEHAAPPGAGAVDLHHGFTNVLSCIRAARVVFNSAFARDSFAAAARELLARLPSPRPSAELEEAVRTSAVVPPGIDLAALPPGPGGAPGAPLRVVFNHRWEHDKDPAAFLRAVAAARERLGGGADAPGIDLLLLGRRYGDLPPGVAEALEQLAPRIVADGFVEDRAEYARLLGTADTVVSTARHEFCGLAVLEAVACGAAPLLPDRLAYPELLPAGRRAEALYGGADELVERLVRLARDPAPLRAPDARARWRGDVAVPHDADRTARALDDLLDEVLHSACAHRP